MTKPAPVRGERKRRKGKVMRDALSDEKARDDLQSREATENARAIATARRFNKNVTFIAHDGCEVTVTPGGHVFHNAADWW